MFHSCPNWFDPGERDLSIYSWVCHRAGLGTGEEINLLFLLRTESWLSGHPACSSLLYWLISRLNIAVRKWWSPTLIEYTINLTNPSAPATLQAVQPGKFQPFIPCCIMLIICTDIPHKLIMKQKGHWLPRTTRSLDKLWNNIASQHYTQAELEATLSIHLCFVYQNICGDNGQVHENALVCLWVWMGYTFQLCHSVFRNFYTFISQNVHVMN